MPARCFLLSLNRCENTPAPRFSPSSTEVRAHGAPSSSESYRSTMGAAESYQSLQSRCARSTGCCDFRGDEKEKDTRKLSRHPAGGNRRGYPPKLISLAAAPHSPSYYRHMMTSRDYNSRVPAALAYGPSDNAVPISPINAYQQARSPPACPAPRAATRQWPECRNSLHVRRVRGSRSACAR